MITFTMNNGLIEHAIICDWCRNRLNGQSDGNVLWQMGDTTSKEVTARTPHGNVTSHAFHVHKACGHAFETTNSGRRYWLWDDIADHMVIVIHNAGIDYQAARDHVEGLRRAGL